ncbi:MAG: M3 family oligoendopeptidase [Promethearchaeota archaeon]
MSEDFKQNLEFTKKRKYISNKIRGNRFLPLWKHYRKLRKFSLNSEENIIIVLEYFSEIFEIIEDNYLRKLIKKMAFGGIWNTIKFIWYFARFGIWVHLKRIRIYKKLSKNPYFQNLPDAKYKMLKRIINQESKLFSFKNYIRLIGEIYHVNRYNNQYGKMTALFQGKKRTISQIWAFVEDPNREVREQAFKTVYNLFLENSEKFYRIFDKLKKIRIKMAKTKKYTNYRDYMHDLKNRFDYNIEDCFEFHKSIEKIVCPIAQKINSEKAKMIDHNIDKIRPWDSRYFFKEKPKGIEDINIFTQKMLKIFYKIKPEYGNYLENMKKAGFFDLENRKKKAPGGFTFPLKDHSCAFIYTNFVGTMRNLITFAHESGHALHDFQTSKFTITQFKENALESAELASMGMEFIFLEYLNEIYKDSNIINKIKLYHLENVILFLPWCAIVDAFQHWIYTNPNHTIEERNNYFMKLMDRFNIGEDWTGLEEYKKIKWLMQTHIFTNPFYYIEYGFAQLGALALYRNYLKNPAKTIEEYDKFLSLGNSKSLPELYKAAGIEFNFSPEYIESLMKFAEEERKRLKSLINVE